MQKQSFDSKNANSSQSSQNQLTFSRNLQYQIRENSFSIMPYRSKFQLNSIGSRPSRESRDSDLLNRLAQQPSKSSSKSLSRNISVATFSRGKGGNHSQMNSLKSNSVASISQESIERPNNYKIVQTIKLVPKIHNCVCFVAGQCLSYNCNCFLSPYPCAPDCCPNCLSLRQNLPVKVTNLCSCKKTKCLKLYCQCLSNGQYCNVMCRCQRCQNHKNSLIRGQSFNNFIMHKGCSCQKSNCQKKYCICFAQGLKCTNKCGCIGCKNSLQMKIQQQQSIQQIPKIIQNNQMQIQIEFQEIDFFGGNKKTK